MFAPSILSKYFANVFRWSYELPGKERTGRCGVPYLCIFAKPYSLAGCAPVDLNLVDSASLISSFFFMASNSLFMSFSIFMITLSVRFFLSLNFCACNKSFSFFSYVSFFQCTKTHKFIKRHCQKTVVLQILSGFFNNFFSGGLFHFFSISLCSCFNLT